MIKALRRPTTCRRGWGPCSCTGCRGCSWCGARLTPPRSTTTPTWTAATPTRWTSGESGDRNREPDRLAWETIKINNPQERDRERGFNWLCSASSSFRDSISEYPSESKGSPDGGGGGGGGGFESVTAAYKNIRDEEMRQMPPHASGEFQPDVACWSAASR